MNMLLSQKQALSLLTVLLFTCLNLLAQETRQNKKEGGFTFTIQKEIATTEVENQYHSGTCWSFSSLSFIETEVLREKKELIDFSEMFIVRNNYLLKAKKYMRMTGEIAFGQGGEFHDVMNLIREKGIVPFEVYSGFPEGQTQPEHGELSAVLKSMLDAALKLPDGKLSPNWERAFEGALDGYFGKTPEKFNYKGKEYTPKSFVQYLGINPDDYIEITSFTHHPFYEKFILEVSDNWAWSDVYNVPLDELKQIVDYAIDNDYSIAWASDVSEPGFSFKNGLAIMPEGIEDVKKDDLDTIFNSARKEKQITQEMRQKAFDNLSTTDDHGMQIVGKAKDQAGTNYYIVKNSWGTDKNDCNGYFYASIPYFLYKTTSIMVNKKALPKEIAKKLNIK